MTVRRVERVADRLRQILARLLGEGLRDPRVGFVTVTEVRVSPDLRYARVFVTSLGPGDPRSAVEALNHAVPFLRRSLAREAGLRFTPELRFLLDDVEESGRRVDHLLDEIERSRPEEEPS